MPVFSLPGSLGIGDLGPSAFRFVDFLEMSGQSIWQLLPLGPTSQGDSPYSSYSAFAGNPLLISCEKLVADGLLTEEQIAADDLNLDSVDYGKVRAIKKPLLSQAFSEFQRKADDASRASFSSFCQQNAGWLTDFARFEAQANDLSMQDWSRWDAPLVTREASVIAELDERLAHEILFAKFEQFLFNRQWQELKSYANERNIRIYGDMPIFVAYESVDVWTNQDLFLLGEGARPTVVAGVPPDYFSETGQMWGNPLYDWERLASTNYDWWTQRIRHAFEYFDILRIDHFRGFESYWEVPADAENAIGGHWRPGPHRAVFDAAREALGDLPIVAEDLGLITDQVHALRDELGFPGMRVLQFGVDHEHDPYHRPDHYPEHCVAYTGTHDNDTVLGWFRERESNGANQSIVARFLSGDPSRIHSDLIAAVLNSAADTAIVPMQDLLALGTDARTNTPGEADGNWKWRCRPEAFNAELASGLRELTEAAGRTPNR